jgi:hypothetical protein
MPIGWYHQTNESEEWDGFNDSGLHHFTSDPLKNMAREIIQNAFDAGDGNKKVEVRFKLSEVETVYNTESGRIDKQYQVLSNFSN